MVYPKPVKTRAEQIALLEERGMTFNDEAAAKAFLEHISYYRLGFYWFDMREKANPSNIKDNTRLEDFIPTARFEDVIKRYNFDAALRHLVLQALEQIEISLKTEWAHHFSQKYKNPLFYAYQGYHKKKSKQKKDPKTFTEIITKLQDLFKNATDKAITKCRDKIPVKGLPEAWIIIELLDFGTFIHLISFLKQKDKQELAHLYAKDAQTDFLKAGEFIKILSQLRVIRNICAHHNRLWNTSFRSIPQPIKSPLVKDALNTSKPQKLYNALCHINYFLRQIDSSPEWQNNLIALIDEHPDYTDSMGFYPDWQTKDLWT